MDGLQIGQLADHPLGIPQGRGVAHRHHNGPVRVTDRQTEPRAQTGGGIHKDVLIRLAGLGQQVPKSRLAGEILRQRQGRGEEIQPGNRGMGRHRPAQGTPAGDDIAEVHQRRVGHAQGNVQVAQSHIAIDAQDLVSLEGQGGPQAPCERGFSCAAFSGCDDNYAAHGHSS